MKGFQKKWKTVGFIPRKIENKLWMDFSKIHKDYFDRLKLGYKKISHEQEKLLIEKTLTVTTFITVSENTVWLR